MDDLFNRYREVTARAAPPDLSALVLSRLQNKRLRTPSLHLVLGSTAGLAAAIAFVVTFLASDDLAQSPPAATLFKKAGPGMFSARP